VENQDRHNSNGRPRMATVLKASEARPETTANTLRGCGRALSCGVVSFLLGVVMLVVVVNVEAKKRLCHLCPDPCEAACSNLYTVMWTFTRCGEVETTTNVVTRIAGAPAAGSCAAAMYQGGVAWVGSTNTWCVVMERRINGPQPCDYAWQLTLYDSRDGGYGYVFDGSSTGCPPYVESVQRGNCCPQDCPETNSVVTSVEVKP